VRPETGEAACGQDLAQLIDQIACGCLVIGSTGLVLYTNRAALRILRRPSGEVVRLDILAALGAGEELRPRFDTLGCDGYLEASLRRGDGTFADIALNIIQAAGGGPAASGMILLLRDQEPRRRLEAELRRVERLSALGRIVAGVAHELRNPLAAVQALAEALDEELDGGDPRRQYTARMLQLLGRVEGFIRTSLEFSQPRMPAPSRQRPAALARSAIQAMSADSRPALAVEVGLQVPEVLVDPQHIVSSLTALLDNALEATGRAARVRVIVGAEIGPDDAVWARIEVRDDGPGVPQEHLARVFDPFFTTKAKGRGLGLALAQTLVGQNGGRLELHSAAGAETVATLLLPGIPR
jgi:two-component system sensor histidine kinase HydH